MEEPTTWIFSAYNPYFLGLRNLHFSMGCWGPKEDGICILLEDSEDSEAIKNVKIRETPATSHCQNAGKGIQLSNFKILKDGVLLWFHFFGKETPL